MLLLVIVIIFSKKNGIKGISFYQLPKDENFKKRWLQIIKRANLQKNPSICHLYFEGCFKQDLEVMQINSS